MKRLLPLDRAVIDALGHPLTLLMRLRAMFLNLKSGRYDEQVVVEEKAKVFVRGWKETGQSGSPDKSRMVFGTETT